MPPARKLPQPINLPSPAESGKARAFPEVQHGENSIPAQKPHPIRKFLGKLWGLIPWNRLEVAIARHSLERVKHIPWAVRLLIARSIYFVTIFLGILVALSAVKDILGNFIAGILLLFARSFELKDQVTVGSFEGTAVDTQIRTTSLHTCNDEIVLIPNSQVFTNAVVNHTRLDKCRYTVAFDTSLSADADLVHEEALRAVQQNTDVATTPAPFVRVKSVDSGNDILSWQVYYWADPAKATEIKTVSDTLRQIKCNLYDAGVPTPTATSATVLRHAVPPPDSQAGSSPKPDSPSDRHPA